jgi:hypothetical protein
MVLKKGCGIWSNGFGGGVLGESVRLEGLEKIMELKKSLET